MAAIKKVKDKSFRLKNFRLSTKAQRELAKAAERLGVPEVRIVEELLTRYAGALQLEFVVGGQADAGSR